MRSNFTGSSLATWSLQAARRISIGSNRRGARASCADRPQWLRCATPYSSACLRVSIDDTCGSASLEIGLVHVKPDGELAGLAPVASPPNLGLPPYPASTLSTDEPKDFAAIQPAVNRPFSPSSRLSAFA